MNPPQPHVNRHGVQGLQTNRYSELEIEAFNRSHDSKMGWSQQFPNLYLNIDRHPETFNGSVKDAWNKP